MGYTVYPTGTTPDEARTREFYGCEVIASSKAWTLARFPNGKVGLFYTRIERDRYGTAAKTMHISEGPLYGNPPRALASAYVELNDGDIDTAGGPYGAPMLRAALGQPSA